MLKKPCLMLFAACLAVHPACAQTPPATPAPAPANAANQNAAGQSPAVRIAAEQLSIARDAAAEARHEARQDAGEVHVAGDGVLRLNGPNEYRLADRAVFVDTVAPGKLTLKAFREPMEKGPILGVATSPVPQALRDQLQLRPGIGLVVDHITPEGPGEQGGLKPSDVIEKLNDQLLVNNQQLAVLIRTYKVGEQVKLSIIRAAKPQVVSVTLAEGDVPPIDELGSEVKFNKFIRTGAPAMTLKPGWNTMDGKGVSPLYGDFLRDRDSSFALNWSDKEHDFSVTQDGGARKLVARDKAGKEIHSGPIDTPEQIEKLPPEIREKVRKLDTKWRQPATRPGSPVTPPAPPAPPTPPAAPSGSNPR